MNEVSDLMKKMGLETFIWADFKEKNGKWISIKIHFFGVKNSKQAEI